MMFKIEEGDFILCSLFMTPEGLGIQVEGTCIVKPLKEWFALGFADEASKELEF